MDLKLIDIFIGFGLLMVTRYNKIDFKHF